MAASAAPLMPPIIAPEAIRRATWALSGVVTVCVSMAVSLIEYPHSNKTDDYAKEKCEAKGVEYIFEYVHVIIYQLPAG